MSEPREEATAPADGAPAPEAVAPEPAEQAPAERQPAEQAPAEQEPAEQAPAEQEPAGQAPTEQAPAEAPTEQAPVEEAPTEHAPTEHTPTEHTPTEQAPAAEPSAEQPAAADSAGEPSTSGTGAELAASTPVDPATPAAAPAPRPSPRPVPRPSPGAVGGGVMRTVAPARPATPRPDPEEAADELVALAQATTFGRVDDDGTVWVRTADGERSVGSYPGASPEDALIYFARKYTDLVAQVDLLEQRIRSTDLAAKDAVPAIDRMRETVAEATVVGDLAALDSRLDALAAVADKRRAKAEAARQRAREAARATKERIVTEAESLAASTQWKATGDRLRELLEEWKVAPRLERKADDELWKRFSAARTAFDKARRQHFATLDSGREDARQRKEKLVKEAESLSGSKDWGPTSARFRDLMTEWKAAGRAGREHEDALWERFRTAQDAFFSARSGVFAERDADQKANLERKEALVVEAEALLPISNLGAAKRAMRSISERWDAIGHVPRGDRDRVEGRLRRVEETIRGAEEGEWRRTNPEARARAEATVAQLRTSIEKLEAQAAKDRAAGKESAAAKSDEAVAVRRTWLAEAERTLADLTR